MREGFFISGESWSIIKLKFIYKMSNQEIAKIFYQIAHYLEMDGVAFKPYAYENSLKKASNSLSF